MKFLPQRKYITSEVCALLATRYFSKILLYALLFDAQNEYSNVARHFLVGDMNFNHVYKEVSKETPFILVFATVMCRN